MENISERLEKLKEEIREQSEVLRKIVGKVTIVKTEGNKEELEE